jgi:RNA polymerase sigma factor (sigma-70 family)
MARLGGDGHAAEDVLQQALVIALGHGSPPTEADEQRAWLRGVVHNAIRRHVRSSHRGRDAVQRAAFERRGAQMILENPGTACDGGSRDRIVRAVYWAVTALDHEDQDLFYAFYRCGLSHASIADRLGTTVKGIEARLYRLRARLRTALEQCGEEAL